MSKRKGKNLSITEFARLGGLKGGRARAEKLSAEERSAIARKAGKARMAKVSAKRRSEIARNAVRARWSKQK